MERATTRQKAFWVVRVNSLYRGYAQRPWLSRYKRTKRREARGSQASGQMELTRWCPERDRERQRAERTRERPHQQQTMFAARRVSHARCRKASPGDRCAYARRVHRDRIDRSWRANSSANPPRNPASANCVGSREAAIPSEGARTPKAFREVSGRTRVRNARGREPELRTERSLRRTRPERESA